jgi:putative ABC transport system substrate-binding protein
VKRRDFIRLLGSAAAWPVAVHGQQSAKSYRIGFLALIPGEDTTLMEAMLERLHELGYSERTNMRFVYRSAEGDPKRLAPLASELVKDSPDVLVAGFGTLAAQAAKAATKTIPVVFTTVGDPLGAGIVASLSRPGGNVTGLTDQAKDVQGKRMQLLLEVIPGRHEVAVLLNPDTPYSRLALEEAKAAAEHGHIRLQVLEARTADQVAQGIEQAAGGTAAGLLIFEDPLIYSIRGRVADLAAQFRLPAMYVYKDSEAYLPSRRRICGQDPEGDQALRSGSGAAHSIHVHHQSQGGEGPWYRSSAYPARYRRRGYRVNCPPAFSRPWRMKTK